MKFTKVFFVRLRATVLWFGMSRLIGTTVSVLVVVMAGWWLLRVPPPPPEATLTFASTTISPNIDRWLDAVAISQTTQVAPFITVHVAGEVKHPGIYKLKIGARVDDGVVAAGGATTRADLNAVNLATPLFDGQQVYISKHGEKPHMVIRPSPIINSGSGQTTNDSPVLININTATAIELEQLPGVGPSTAQAIIEYRTTAGVFSVVEDLLNVRGIGPAKLRNITPLARVN